MNETQHLFEQMTLLVNRLERISVDSIWARRASGQRGALLRWIERLQNNVDHDADLSYEDLEKLKRLIHEGYRLLERAAKERVR
ncbi:MAG: hypothetical protein QME21_15190 [Anaerolineales bacterium]|nr:hypothetical protein [Anaerolineales bacterium]